MPDQPFHSGGFVTARALAPGERGPEVFVPNGVRPSGLPIFSTEKLTGAERAQLLALQEGYHRAALMIDLSLAIGRVDEALSTLQSLTRDLDGQAAAIAAALGSNR